jgi:hypothetical protein
VLLGVGGGIFWMVFGFQQLEFVRYLAGLQAMDPELALREFTAPQVLNPFNGAAGGFIAPWFLIVGLLLRQARANPLLWIVALVAFADLLVGFLAPLAGYPQVAYVTAGIAGAIGGPAFWILAGLDLRRWIGEGSMTRATTSMATAK